MVQAGRGGSIIHVSSQMGHVGARDRTVYCASKHALEGLTKAMAVDLGAFGIRVNSLAPTFIETELNRSFLADPDFRRDALGQSKRSEERRGGKEGGITCSSRWSPLHKKKQRHRQSLR